jgi:chromosome segregation ATPase
VPERRSEARGTINRQRIGDMTENLDKRVADLEALIADLPELLNVRFQRVDATLSEFTARFNLLDKQMAMLVRDMRDLRGGVTRQLVEQDKRLTAIEQKLDGHDRRLAAMESDVAAIRADVKEILNRLPKP